MTKRRKIILFAVLIVIAAAVLSLMYWPKQLDGSMTVSSSTGETAVVEWDLTYYKSLLLPSFTKGTLTVDGVEYTDLYTKMKALPGETDYRLFASNWWQVNQSMPYNMTFTKSEFTHVEETFGNQIVVTDIVIEKNIQTISFAYFDDSNRIDNPDGSSHTPGIQFYGPAQNAEEASDIAKSFGYTAP